MEQKDYFDSGHNVFVCGALQNPAKMASVLGRDAPFAPAVSLGFYRETQSINGRNIPFMIDDLGDSRRPLTGVVWVALSDADLGRIEELELAGDLRERIAIEVLVGERRVQAFTYVKKRK